MFTIKLWHMDGTDFDSWETAHVTAIAAAWFNDDSGAIYVGDSSELPRFLFLHHPGDDATLSPDDEDMLNFLADIESEDSAYPGGRYDDFYQFEVTDE